MKRVPKPVFFVVALLILAFSFTAIFGISYYTGDNKTTVLKGISDIRWGIDIRGGVEATFKPAGDVDATDEQLESAKSIIELRMVSQGITDYELYADAKSDRIIVRFPWKEDSDQNAIEAIEEISSTAQLTFRPGKEYSTTDVDSNGEYVYKTPSGDTAKTILMDGSYVESATAGMTTDQSTGKNSYVVQLKLKSDGDKNGKELFGNITKEYLNQTVSIWMDDIMLSAPTVNAEITDGNAVIAIIMILFYRLPGFVAVISLLGQMGLAIAAVSGYFPVFSSFTMTLPGIAGLILSIGMGVDCNVITAERIKEELKAGRTLDGALERGTKNSLSAIVDGNMTVIIVSIILMLVFGPANILSIIFGESTTGTIYSFGYTLLVGVIANFIMGVFCTRIMLRSVAGFKFLRKKWLFGGAKND